MNLHDYLAENVFRQPENRTIQADFAYWHDFLRHKIAFHIHSDLHGVNHCGRVLLYALILADKMALSVDFKEILCHAAVFHDSQRFDDGFDVGHGLRGADYYQKYCKINDLKFYPEAYFACAYHDRDDDFGICEITQNANDVDKSLFIYKLFKDADALDRYRLGLDGLDARFLRFDESKNMTDFARNCVLQTENFVPESVKYWGI